MARRVRLNFEGLKEIADSPEMHRAVEAAGRAVADEVNRGHYVAGGPGKESPAELRAEVEMKSGPAVAVVIVKHPAALAMQAKHGMLTRALSAVGFEVKASRR